MLENIAAGISPQYSVGVLVGLKVLIAATVFLPFVNVISVIGVWAERKIAGHIQSRVGPRHVGPHGLLQTIADGIKLLCKEDLIPQSADHFMFRLAPYLAFAPVFAAFLALPFGPQLCFETGLHIGVIYLLAVLSVEVMGTILAGWGSNSKWAVYGAMREACQMVSYEIPLGVSIICGLLVAGTSHMTDLAYLQGGGLWDWFVFHNPFIFCAFLVYVIASLASTKRAPFDLPESESELVAGFHTEYSGFRWMYFFAAEYGGMFIVGAIQALLFLGGWNSPLGQIDPVYLVIDYDPMAAGQAYFSGDVASASTWSGKAAALGLGSSFGLIVLNAYSALWLIAKASAVLFFHMWLRWTLPRIRIDQVLYTCVKVLLPASLILLTGTALWLLFVPQAGVVTLGAQEYYNVGHLVGQTPVLQLLVQIVLTVIGVAIFVSVVSVVVWAFVHRNTMPMKTFFPDTMPVGTEIAFTSGVGDKESSEEVADAGDRGAPPTE